MALCSLYLKQKQKPGLMLVRHVDHGSHFHFEAQPTPVSVIRAENRTCHVSDSSHHLMILQPPGAEKNGLPERHRNPRGNNSVPSPYLTDSQASPHNHGPGEG